MATTEQATLYEQIYYPEGTPDDFQAALEAEPLKRVIWNIGCPTSVYDPSTGLHCQFGKGIYEYRIGDEVICVGGKRFTIESIVPGKDRKGRFSAALCRLVFKGGKACIVSMATPSNPERMGFGFVVRTVSEHNGRPTGSASRYITRAQAEAEVSRLVGINYPGAIMILDSE